MVSGWRVWVYSKNLGAQCLQSKLSIMELSDDMSTKGANKFHLHKVANFISKRKFKKFFNHQRVVTDVLAWLWSSSHRMLVTMGVTRRGHTGQLTPPARSLPLVATLASPSPGCLPSPLPLCTQGEPWAYRPQPEICVKTIILFIRHRLKRCGSWSDHTEKDLCEKWGNRRG